jgi:hypothetical protein
MCLELLTIDRKGKHSQPSQQHLKFLLHILLRLRFCTCQLSTNNFSSAQAWSAAYHSSTTCPHLYLENMSKQDVSHSASDAVLKQTSQQPQSEVAPHTRTPYQAAYIPHDWPMRGRYFVAFYPGHTIEKHFAFLQREFEVNTFDVGGYTAQLDDQLFNAVRCDPGVEFVEDNFTGKRD